MQAEVKHILAALTPPNRLALEISLATGLRIGDVLGLRTAQLAKRMTVCEQKTGKKRRVFLSDDLLRRCISFAGRTYVLEHRLSPLKHRTRQAVFKDLRRACKLFRIDSHVTPHSMRKIYAVEALKRTGDIKRVQQLLNHSDEAVTMLYAMADRINKRTRAKAAGKTK